ncbi:MAG TPA: chromate efflux transporter [Terriglobales bacterium]|nr:chromate efflux transporter [Terriglobales bacterium]
MSGPRTTLGLIRYFLYLGSVGFGGPAALIGYMQRDLVEKRDWFTRDDYIKGLALSQLAPGPLAAQLAICLGYCHGGIWGATAVGVAFVAPSFLMTVALGALYVAYGGLSWMQAAFYGVGAAVIGIIVRSAWRLGTLTLGKDRVLWAVFTVMGLITAWTESEIGLLFVLCGVVVMLIEAPPRWLLGLVGSTKALWSAAWPALLLTGFGAPASSGILFDILWFFAKAGAFVFGSGLAIVPFLYGGVVQEHHWLSDKQFLDAVAVAMITPGPVVITVAFIGYLVAGFGGAVAAGIGVFLPVYLFVIVLYPFFDRWSANPQVKAFVHGVTAAAAGAIAGACFVLGERAVFDVPTAALAVGTLVLLWRFKAPEPVLIVGAGLTGFGVFWLRGAV